MRYSNDVIQAQRTHGGIMHQSLMISILICNQFVPLMFAKQWTNFGSFFQTVVLASNNFMKLWRLIKIANILVLL